MYPIEDDEYYAVVTVAPEGSGGDVNLPRPQFRAHDSIDVSDAWYLDHGDLKIFQLPYRFPAKPHEASDKDRKKERKKSLIRGHVKDIGSTVGIQSYP